MCTVTILYNAQGYQLTMNRDERQDREAEISPVHDGTAIYPRDGAAGGTWVAATDAGESFCLLNRYDAVEYAPTASRGEIILRCIKNSAGWLSPETLSAYISFTLLHVTLNTLQQYDWNGVTLECSAPSIEPYFHLSSSSWNAEQVLAFRKEQAETWWKEGAALDVEKNIPTYHIKSVADKEAYSVCVSRPHTHTKSITQIAVEKGAIPNMKYWAL